MQIKQLKINHLRNLTAESVNFTDGFNFIYGDNGSGKTSVLEAIYLLGTGHSFRTRETNPLIQDNQSQFTIFARSFEDDSVSICKSKSGQTHAKINQTPCRTSSELAQNMPCQIFYQDIFNIIDSGPSVRRHILDWGMFHVEPLYLELWKKLKRVVKQRNALLKQRASRKDLEGWDQQLCDYSKQIDVYRKAYFENWMSVFFKILPELSPIEVNLEYYRGWPSDGRQTIEDIMKDKYASDLQRQYTQIGAHQADIKILPPQQQAKAKFVYSRGQQKMILIALKLAQSKLLKQNCLYLFDDLSSELDSKHVDKLFQYLNHLEGQYFITSTDSKLGQRLSDTHKKIFNLEKGQFKELTL